MTVETDQNNNPLCKHCNSTTVRKYGKYKGVQRYFCNDCGSKFKAASTSYQDTHILTLSLLSFYAALIACANGQFKGNFLAMYYRVIERIIVQPNSSPYVETNFYFGSAFNTYE
jgi:hypothetical protein